MLHNPHLSVVLVFSIALALVLASPGRSPHHEFLQKRVDATCYNSCSQYSTLLNSPNCTASSLTCICSSDVVKALVDCCNCGVALSTPATADATRAQMQQSLTSYAQSCKLLGVDVGNLTITATPNSVSTTATACTPDFTDILNGLTLGL